MQELANETNETTYLAVPREGEVIYLDSCSPKNQLSTRSMLGIKAPLYCTGIGKAMLAFLPEEIVDSVISGGLAKYTDQTIDNPKKLREEPKGKLHDLHHSHDGLKVTPEPTAAPEPEMAKR